MNKKEFLSNLRHEIQALEQSGFTHRPNSWDLGAPDIDMCFPAHGLDGSGIHNVLWAHLCDYCAGLAFILALCARNAPHQPLIWCVQKGRNPSIPYMHGLIDLGFPDPEGILYVEVNKETDVLWAMEEALRHGNIAAVLGEVSADLTQSRRLHLAAQDAGSPCFLLHHNQTLPVNGANTRWQVTSAQSTILPFDPKAPGKPRWQLELVRNRNGRLGHWNVEWQYETRHFHISASLADRTLATGQSETGMQFSKRACT